jgi:hypothetical protein
MSYLALLKEKIGNTNPQTGTDRTDKRASVSFVSAVSALSAGNSGPSATATASPRVELMAALTSFRDIARRYDLNVPADDRVTCGECLRLVKGRCGAAKLGLMPDTQPDYSPGDVDIPHRCAYFVAKGPQ